MMRKAETTDSELKELLQAELVSFKELDTLKKAMREGLAADNPVSLQEWELLKAQWQDSADEIKHLHRKLHPYYPQRGACSICGCDTLPALGSNTLMSVCIACGNESVDWSL